MSATAAIPYIAECPTCGQDAKWRDILASLKTSTQQVRTVVQIDIQCDHCGPLEIEVDE